MTLRQYLIHHGMSEQAFAKRIGLSQAAVNRYCKGRVPAAEVMKTIIRATDGAVTANDFFSTPSCEINSHPHDQVSGVVADAGGPDVPLVVAPDTTARPVFFSSAKKE